MTVMGVQRTAATLDLARYVTGAAINKNGESSGLVGGTALFAVTQGGVWAWKNRKNIRGGLQTVSAEMTANKAIMRSAAKPGSGIWNAIKNFWRGGTEIVSKSKLQSLARSADSSAVAAQNALATGRNFTEGLKAIENSSGRGILKNIGKGIKGNACFAAISFGLGVITDVIPAFKLGTKEGFSQLGKTSVKTVAEVGGWAAGSAVGAKIGAAAGALIGGPIGAAVGGILGAAGGFVGSFLCSKVAEMVVGPSETQLAQENLAKEISMNAISKGDAGVSEVAQTAYNKLLQSAAANGGKLSAEDLKAKEALEQLTGQEIDVESDLAQMAAAENSPQASDDSAQVAGAQGGAPVQAAPADQSEQVPSQVASAQAASQQVAVSRTTNDLPATSAAYPQMGGLPTFQMPTNPYLSCSGVNPFATPTTNSLASNSSTFYYQDNNNEKDKGKKVA